VADEIIAAARAGLRLVGHNYAQEAETMKDAISRSAPDLAGRLEWRMIGHLQRNKARRAAVIFDMIETVDSPRLALALDRAAAEAGKVMPVLIEVNSGRESGKSGVMPEQVEALARDVVAMPHLRLGGLMTMGVFAEDAEATRPSFRLARELFEHLAALRLANAEMSCLSMGMSDSYRVAIEEGATVVRLGTALFGPRRAPRQG
jgi:pyridoxal phosphate enzyme (YggS family)